MATCAGRNLSGFANKDQEIAGRFVELLAASYELAYRDIARVKRLQEMSLCPTKIELLNAKSAKRYIQETIATLEGSKNGTG